MLLLAAVRVVMAHLTETVIMLMQLENQPYFMLFLHESVILLFRLADVTTRRLLIDQGEMR